MPGDDLAGGVVVPGDGRLHPNPPAWGASGRVVRRWEGKPRPLASPTAASIGWETEGDEGGAAGCLDLDRGEGGRVLELAGGEGGRSRAWGSWSALDLAGGEGGRSKAWGSCQRGGREEQSMAIWIKESEERDGWRRGLEWEGLVGRGSRGARWIWKGEGGEESEGKKGGGGGCKMTTGQS